MLSVQTNLGGNTALKNLNTNTLNMNKAMNKLSSGFRINSAADDAAGFAVSSKLDGQALRLKASSLNATQAQAMVKMADAGVNQIQNMVNRIQTLAVQASSSNNAGELGKLNAERIKLESAINKIAQGTNFNGINLLDGTAKNMTVTTGVKSGSAAQTLTFGTATGVGTTAGSGIALFTEKASFTMTVKSGIQTGTSGITSVTSNVALHDVSGKVIAQAGQNLVGNAAIGLTFSYTGVATSAAGTVTTTAAGGSAAGTAGSTVANFQVGANNNANDQVGVNLLNSYTTASLGLGTGDLTTQVNAQKYIDTAKVALNAVVTQRADLGATQNQLGFIKANLATSIEQTTASVSAIRDTDMAAQMANFTKNKILSQVGTSMLAQANQAAQNVMSLFR